MAKKLQIVYITGLGNTEKRGQKLAVKVWRLYGIQPYFFDTKWGDGEAWQTKFDRLLKLIDELKVAGAPVALVGVSAGASAAINAYAVRKDEIAGVALVSGWVNGPEDIDPRHNEKNPAFVESAHQSPESLARLAPKYRGRILSHFAYKDELVSKSASYIPQAINRATPLVGHIVSIAVQITFGAPSIIRFLKKQAKIQQQS